MYGFEADIAWADTKANKLFSVGSDPQDPSAFLLVSNRMRAIGTLGRASASWSTVC